MARGMTSETAMPGNSRIKLFVRRLHNKGVTDTLYEQSR